MAWSTRVTFALFYVALLNEFGWQRGEAALGYSLSWLLLLVFGPLAGRLTDRWGPREVVPMGGLLLGAALALTGRVQALWHYNVSFGVFGAAGMACIMMPATVVVSRWFTQSRGTAMGIISAGASSSAALFYPFTVWLITTLGWRDALAVYGGVVAVGIGSLAACLYRRQPTEMSAAPDGRLAPPRRNACRPRSFGGRPLTPNATLHLLPEAAARHERRLEAVRCMRVLGRKVTVACLD